ncbi:MAG TPA: SCP2 sterol-binding domain-containing protein [Solirubrobacterales bacterium]|jgi:ribonucleoside-diphosphate reductase beta chain|nr:SCP2 sterol-binding domain-containing protein [Solirubrobacterales bacterium]
MATKDRAGDEGTMNAALRRMAESEPELAARLMLQSLPAAAASLPNGLSYRLELDELGAWRVARNGRRHAEVTEVSPGEDLNGDAFAIQTDARTLAELAAGRNPLTAMFRGRLRLRGKARKALALRNLSQDAGPRELARMGLPLDADLLYRSLAYAIEPEWTLGYSFRIAYELLGDQGGAWTISVDDGSVSCVRGAADDADASVRMRRSDWLKLLTGELDPTDATRLGLTELEGDVFAATLVGRWIDRAEGVDGPELDREARQARRQAKLAGSWGSAVNGSGASSEPGDPGESKRQPGGLMSYEQLYALWERQNWRAHELDFSADREHWLATPSDAQVDTLHSFGSFYVGEERVTADLAPFLLAAPSGEVEAFLATQLVDEMRHAVFFDRFMAEVMALEADDLRSRLRKIEEELLTQRPWHFLFDDSLRDIADRIKAQPDDLKLFVEGIVTYHMVTEGVLAMPGQRILIQYTGDHKIYPGFNKGFRLVEQDEHRHIAFGVRFLKDVCEERPEMKQVIVDRLCELLPEAAKVFVPPQETNSRAYWSYGQHSSQVYGFAYQALNRRMKMIGVEIPGPEELMPGPVDFSGLDERSRIREPTPA